MELSVYGKRGCPACNYAVAVLTGAGFLVRMVYVSGDHEIFDRARSDLTPIIEAGDDVYVGAGSLDRVIADHGAPSARTM